MVPFLEVVGVSRTFGVVKALTEASMIVESGRVYGLCGHNGAGKSTLIKIMMGLIQPESGVVRIAGEIVHLAGSRDARRKGLALVEQEMGLVRDLTVRENLFLGSVHERFIHRRSQVADARELLKAVGLTDVDPGRRVSSLQPGEIKLVEIARALADEPKVIILDEPTASLSYDEARRVFAAVRSAVERGAAVIFVSHRLGEVMELCTEITVMRDGRVVGSGGVESFSQTRIVELMIDERRVNRDTTGREAGSAEALSARIEKLTIGSEVEEFSLEIPASCIIGIAGQVGSGASEVLRAVAGLLPATGKVSLGNHTFTLAKPSVMARNGVCFVPQDRAIEGLFLDRSVAANLTSTRLSSISRGGFLGARRLKREALRLFSIVGVRANSFAVPVGTLSGGNQQKVLIGRSLDRGRRSLFLLDDPTRGVDVGGRAEIHDLIRAAADSGDAVVFVSTELDELLVLADTVVTMFEGKIVSIRSREDVTAAGILAEMTGAS